MYQHPVRHPHYNQTCHPDSQSKIPFRLHLNCCWQEKYKSVNITTLTSPVPRKYGKWRSFMRKMFLSITRNITVITSRLPKFRTRTISRGVNPYKDRFLLKSPSIPQDMPATSINIYGRYFFIFNLLDY